MNKFIYKLGIVAVILAMISISCDTVTQTTIEEPEQTVPMAGEVISGQYIVVLTPDETEQETRGKEYAENFTLTVMNEAGIPEDAITNNYSTVLVGFSATLDETQLNRLKLDPRVDYIEEDKVVTLAPPCGTPNGGPCDPDDGGGDSGGGDTTVITPWGIDRVGGSVSYTGSAVSWVIDTGIQLDHPDLNVDASRGFTAFAKGPDSKNADDGNGHGTHVAGTIGAHNSILGVASGVVQVPVKVLDRRGSGSVSGVIAGVDYVAANANPGDVANMSLGGGASQSLDDAVIAAADGGILFSIAAGNSGTWASGSSPARVDHPNTWTIAATDINDNFASFSNYGTPTSFAAPGVSIESTWTGSSYRTISGTSMAAPHVAGILLVTGGTVNSNGTSSAAPNGDTYPIASN